MFKVVSNAGAFFLMTGTRRNHFSSAVYSNTRRLAAPQHTAASCWCLYRQHPQGRQARRSASVAVDQIRVCHQPANGASARHRGATRGALHRRRGDRVADQSIIPRLLRCTSDFRVGSKAAVRPRGAEGPQHFQYPTTCCTAAHRGFVPTADICSAANYIFDHLVGALANL
jgi:hypothetical protein